MYKIINCEQRSEEWFKARLGKWTSSFFSKAITNTGKLSTAAIETNYRLIAELIVGEPDESFQSDAMFRGKDLENEALNFLNFTQNYEFQECGFLDSEKGYGCSPDAVDLKNKIGLEMKCPMMHTHLEYLAGGHLPKKFKAQVQGSLMISGFDKWIFFSYHPLVKPLIVTVERDEEYIKKLRDIIVSNVEILKKRYKELIDILKE